MKILTTGFLAVLLAGGAAAGEQKKEAAKDAWKTKTFTAEELKKYNGKDGMPVYAAVDGIVYDLSKSKYWRTGRHMKTHDAGADLSSAIHTKAPSSIHKDGKILEKMPKVGVMAGDGAEKTAAAAAPQTAESKLPVSLHKVTKEEVGLETACPVTGEKIKVSENTPALDFKGKTYYFSGLSSLKKFSAEPKNYLGGLKDTFKGLFKKKKG
jgi:predicted heme/steroid binding protein/YHS domain-containing protein